MSVTEKKALVISAIFSCTTIYWNIRYLSEWPYWQPIIYISEASTAGVLQYALSIVVVLIMSVLEYRQMKRAGETKMLWLEMLAIPIVWPLKWLLVVIVMSLPNCLL